jgi:hypothetical protein
VNTSLFLNIVLQRHTDSLEQVKKIADGLLYYSEKNSFIAEGVAFFLGVGQFLSLGYAGAL